MARALSRLGALVLFAALAARSGEGAPEIGVSGSWDYHVTVQPGLATLGVKVCFRGAAPAQMVLDDDSALPFLRLPPGGRGVPGLRRHPTAGLSLVGTPANGCVEYGVDLARMAQDDGRGGARFVGSDVICKPGRWLLRPHPRTSGMRSTLTLDLPPGIFLSAPWPRSRERAGTVRYVLDETVWRFEAHVALGRFVPEDLAVPGGMLEVSVLDGALAASREGIRRWLVTAAGAMTPLFRGFSQPRAQVLVQPSRRSRASVQFGMTRLGGGGGVILYLSGDAKDEDLPGEWVAVHEFVHLGIPALREADSWFNEGITTYYQEVLRARAGLQSEQQAWQEIHEGFQRGISVGGERTLAEESAAMHRHHTYYRVYWGGAALALRMDVEIRRLTNGRSSLDDAMRLWRRDYAGVPRLWAAEDLLRAVDLWLKGRAATAVVEPWLLSARFPRFDDLYADLGIVVEGDRVRLVDAPRSEVRRQIMAAATRSP